MSLPRGGNVSQVEVFVDSRDVTRAFVKRPNGRLEGLVRGLRNGRSFLTARLPGGHAAHIAITNHPIGGPVFAGPQVQPWFCTTESNGLGKAKDAQCNAPTKIEYVYKPSDDGDFKAYDRRNPPSDISNRTTDQGVTVPYIVRVETGTMDRGIYQTAVLTDPNKSPSYKAWNYKLSVPFGGGCAPHYAQTGAGAVDDMALGRGFAVATSGLFTLGNNCNTVVAAEALTMLKEHITETLGPIRYTIGRGCSGGSIMLHSIASAYPGLLDGITPECSFADIWSTAVEVLDCGLLDNYFTYISPHLWAVAAQRAAVEGHANVGSACLAWTALFLPNADPQNRGAFNLGVHLADNCGVPRERIYNPDTNPKGVRCTISDYQRAIWGQRPASLWGPVERKIGYGFAKRPADNIGVQYGLSALNSGQILPEQFVDLNEKIGGADIDAEPGPQRLQADPGALATAYRSGMVSDAHQLAKVPIIDIRLPDNEEIHQSYYSYTMRARLDEANGTHGNQIIWTNGSSSNAFLMVDRWLASMERDRRDVPVAQRVIQNKPAGAVDACWIQDRKITDVTTCKTAFPYYANPRIAAGGPWANNVLKCQLRPLNRADYDVALTDAQWARLNKAFPTGVCDWRKAGVEQRRVDTWMTYARGPGGKRLPAAPRSTTAAR